MYYLSTPSKDSYIPLPSTTNLDTYNWELDNFISKHLGMDDYINCNYKIIEIKENKKEEQIAYDPNYLILEVKRLLLLRLIKVCMLSCSSLEISNKIRIILLLKALLRALNKSLQNLK